MTVALLVSECASGAVRRCAFETSWKGTFILSVSSCVSINTKSKKKNLSIFDKYVYLPYLHAVLSKTRVLLKRRLKVN